MHPCLPLIAGLVLAAGQWPVPGPILAPYAPPAHDWQPGHRGVDLASAPGDPVRAMAAGTVAFVGLIAGTPVVTVRYPGTSRLRSTYEPVEPAVRVGMAVSAGQVLGRLAAGSPHCAVPCLHVGLRTDTLYLDPAILVGRPAAVLKPTRSGSR